VSAVDAFLDVSHRERAARMRAWAREALWPRPEARSDEAARVEARELLTLLGNAGWLQAIERRDLRELCLIREAVAEASPLADAVVALQALGGVALILGGDEVQRAAWLGGITGGITMTAFVMTEPNAGSDVASITTAAQREGDGWRIDGDKHLISNAGIADLHVVFARTAPEKGSRGISAFLVQAGTAGLEFTGAQVMSAPHPLGRLRFSACRLPDTALLGPLDQGFKLGMRTLDFLRPTVGAAACGFAARALSEAVSHARSRQQFGQRLADMPVVRNTLGRMATSLDAARLLVYRAAWEQSQGVPRLSAPAAMAKSFATETAQRIVDQAVQICGGVGVLADHPVERLYRAVRALRIYEGATDVLHAIVGGHLVDEADRA
jgi:acyl-CoA dehydrogenase